MITSKIKTKLIIKALMEHGDINPCSNKTFDECFSIMETPKGKLVGFWYNKLNKSTSLLTEVV